MTLSTHAVDFAMILSVCFLIYAHPLIIKDGTYNRRKSTLFLRRQEASHSLASVVLKCDSTAEQPAASRPIHLSVWGVV